MERAVSFGWTRFIIAFAVICGIPAFLIFANVRSGTKILDPSNMGLILLTGSLLCFFGYRWQWMQRAFANKEFTESEFRANPVKFVIGSMRYFILWLAVTFVLVFLPILMWAFNR